MKWNETSSRGCFPIHHYPSYSATTFFDLLSCSYYYDRCEKRFVICFELWGGRGSPESRESRYRGRGGNEDAMPSKFGN